MAALGLLITTDDELVNLASGRECDTVVGFSELFGGDVKSHVDATWTRIMVVADSVVALRAMLPQLVAMGCASKVFDLVIGGLPKTGLVRLPNGSVGIRAVVSAQQQVVEQPIPHVRLTMRFRGLLRLADVLATTLEGGTSTFRRPTGGLRLGIDNALPWAMPWACGDPAAVRIETGATPVDGDVPDSIDVVLTDAAGPPDAVHPAVVRIGGHERRPTWRTLVDAPRAVLESFATEARDGTLVPPVDTHALRPVGFLPTAGGGEARLRRVGRGEITRFVLAGPDGWSSSVFDDWSGLSERVVDEARHLRVVHDDARAHSGPVEQAAFLVQAAGAALPVVVADLSRTVRHLVGEPLAVALTSGVDLRDSVRREAYCMTLSRLALQRHGASRRWRDIARSVGRPTRDDPTVSVVLPTKRPDLLPRIVDQVARQDWPNLELVLGLHGFTRSHPRVHEFEARFDRPLTVVEIPADRVLGDMLDDLCARAAGTMIAKMDDDDWYSAHHITDLVHAAEFSRADLVGSGAEFLYLEALDLTIRRHRTSGHRYANRVPGATLLMTTHALDAVGGWRPLHRGVDTALAQAVTDSGGTIYRTHGLGIVVYRAAQGHTWDPGAEYFLRGDIDQWPGFAPPPGIIGDPPARVTLPLSWFDHPLAE